uniref:Uncharacterized protein n=1 Tax=Schizaphis graminum TaxID=13262 RepID=A0A2S2NZN8_SCHGA
MIRVTERPADYYCVTCLVLFGYHIINEQPSIIGRAGTVNERPELNHCHLRKSFVQPLADMNFFSLPFPASLPTPPPSPPRLPLNNRNIDNGRRVVDDDAHRLTIERIQTVLPVIIFFKSYQYYHKRLEIS